MNKLLTYLISDDRYAVPTLGLHVDRDIPAARSRAITDLLASPHHRRIEVCEGDILLFALDRRDID